jgi:hypothetical protein
VVVAVVVVVLVVVVVVVGAAMYPRKGRENKIFIEIWD